MPLIMEDWSVIGTGKRTPSSVASAVTKDTSFHPELTTMRHADQLQAIPGHSVMKTRTPPLQDASVSLFGLEQ